MKQRTPGPSRLSKKNLKRPAGIGLAIPCSPLAIDQPQIPYKKARKDATHSALAPENFNQVIHAVINPQIAQHGAVWSDSKHRVIGAVEVHVSASPTETVTVQPDGTIQHGRKLMKKKKIMYIYSIECNDHDGFDTDLFFLLQTAHGDPQGEPLPVLAADDLAGLDDL